tara:strand:+ start:17662 stop:17892 length:231 start_codon:yes stop_codon:yes gene_type:complete
MTNEDIICMAREALKEDDGEDYYAYTHQIPHWWGKEDEIVKFAALVAAAEREECAKRLDAIGCDHCAENIRLRGRE